VPRDAPDTGQQKNPKGTPPAQIERKTIEVDGISASYLTADDWAVRHRLAPEAMKRIFDRKELQMSERAQDLLCWLGIFCSGCGLVVLLSLPALARDDGRYAQSPLKPWFDSLKSGKGPCCSDADGYAVSDPDRESKDGHYRVRLEDGLWYDVPEDALITEPNRVGRTMVWPITGSLLHARRDDIGGTCTK